MTRSLRSPLFYVGDKSKIIRQIEVLFPNEIDTFYDVFCGGGSASINIKANQYRLNDIDSNVIRLHEFLMSGSNDVVRFIEDLQSTAKMYGLSLSEKETNAEIESLKKTHGKTYFSVYNKESYSKLRMAFNTDKERIDLLYLLLIYGFNHMIRFNKANTFNLPVGNVDWNKNVTKAILDYANWSAKNDIEFSNYDFEDFVLKNLKSRKGFFYFDPPYLITFSDYNKLWNENLEIRLYRLLDYLNEQGIQWGLSNMLVHKGRENTLLKEWLKKYNVYLIESNYISRFDNTQKNSQEVYVTNVRNETLFNKTGVKSHGTTKL